MSAPSHRYSLYGLTVVANRAIDGLCPARAIDPARTVTIDFAGGIEPRPSSAPFMVSGVETVWHLDAERWLVEYRSPEKGYLWTALHEPGRIVVRWSHDAILDDIAPILQGAAITPTLHLRGVLQLHACVIAIDDFAVAVAGVPGGGKSTTAAAFLAAGYAIVSDDLAAIDADGRVESGHPRLRVYPDSVRAAGLDASRLRRVFAEPLLGDKCFLELGPGSFREGARPLRAVYLLQPRVPGARAATIAPLDERAAVPALMKNLYGPRFLDRPRMQKSFAGCVRLVSQARVRRVQAADDLALLAGLVDAIAADARMIGK